MEPPLIARAISRFGECAPAPSPLSMFSSCASIALKSLKSTIDLSAFSSALSVDNTAEEADWTGGEIYRGREAAQKRFWMKGEDCAGGPRQVCDVMCLEAELQMKGESRHGEAGQDATRWASAVGL
jgi:hypothetical protein